MSPVSFGVFGSEDCSMSLVSFWRLVQGAVTCHLLAFGFLVKRAAALAFGFLVQRAMSPVSFWRFVHGAATCHLGFLVQRAAACHLLAFGVWCRGLEHVTC